MTIFGGPILTSQHKGCSPSLRPVCQRANPDEENYRLESRVRENRTHGSEGGDGESRFRPLSGSLKFLDSGRATFGL